MQLRDQFPDCRLQVQHSATTLVLDHVGGGRGHVPEGGHEIAGGVHTYVVEAKEAASTAVRKKFGEAGEGGVDRGQTHAGRGGLWNG